MKVEITLELNNCMECCFGTVLENEDIRCDSDKRCQIVYRDMIKPPYLIPDSCTFRDPYARQSRIIELGE